MADSRITIVPFDSHWAEEFKNLAAPMRKELEDLALRIDHIGSTSVSGLAAKDRIDMQITVSSVESFASIKPGLEKLGYKESERIFCDHVPPGGPSEATEWEKRFYNPPAEQRATNLHVRISGRANQIYPILFRDFLRSNSSAAEAYAQVKQQLSRYHPNDKEAYCDIKDPVCDIIICAAKIWSVAINWTPTQSDA